MVLNDILLVLIFSVLCMLIVATYIRVKGMEEKEGRWMFYALIIKLLGAVLYLVIHDYGFGYKGDSHAYFIDAIKLKDVFFHSPKEYFQLIAGSSSWFDMSTYSYVGGLNFQPGSKEFVMDVICSPLVAIGLNNYYATTLLFTAVMFIGHWQFYKVLSLRYPRIRKWAFIAIFGVPSVVIWGSGIVKENIVLAMLGIFLLGVHKYTRNSENRLKWFLLALFTIGIIFMIKLYVVISLLPVVFLWMLSGMWKESNNVVVRKVIKPLVALGIVGLSIIMIDTVRKDFEQLQFDYFISKAQDMQGWHYKEGSNTSEQHGRGSSYTLGEYAPTITGTISMVPISIVTTYYRPFVWEVSKPLMAMVSMESLVFLILSLYILFQRRFYTQFSAIISDPFLVMIFVYSLIFGFIVGFTSYNFGALDRYKLPSLPLFVFSLFVVLDKMKIEKLREQG